MEQRLRHDGHMVMVVAEGAGQGLVPESVSDVGPWLNNKIKVRYRMILCLQKLKLKVHDRSIFFPLLGMEMDGSHKNTR